ncbi:MAG TPA: outer membrane beta-barrel protein [Chitinophagaceae bacterium]
MRKPALFLLFLFTTGLLGHSQTSSLKGTVTDTTEKKNLHLAVVSLLKKSDTTLVTFTRSDKTGKFLLPRIDTGRYILMVSFPRFADYIEVVDVKANTDIGTISMTPKSKLLDEVILRSGAAIRIKGDTTEFVADSFKVSEGATVEDLLKKLPGFSVNSRGEIVAQGKRVDKVLVDGEEFFGDDPTMATQNISAKAVDRVQVFETKTEQQQLTGMSTGNEGKTVNIKLKEDAKKGSFGKIYAGSDFDKFIDSKLLYNRFRGKKKISTFLTRTNVNAGSLNWEDRQKLGIENDYEYDELSGYYFSFGGSDDFNDWNLRGLPDAFSAGALFSNKWRDDINNINLSYRFNSLRTTNTGVTLTQNIVPSGLTYSNKYSSKNGLNQQHAVNAKYEWKLDSLASIKITSVNTYKTGDVSGTNDGEFIGITKDTVNQSFNRYNNQSKRSQTDNQLTYKQLFKKKNRQWQTVVRYGVIDDDNDGLNHTRIKYFKNGVFNVADTVDQQKLFTGRSTTMGIKTTFVEPLSDKWMLMFDYAYNKNHSTSLRNTFEKSFNGKYEVLAPEFSNNFELDAFSHSSNGIIRYTGKKLKAGFGTGISSVKLRLLNLDNSTMNNYNFLNITPQAQLNFLPKAQMNIGINYRGTTRQPTINQLQPLRDNTDPLNEYIGNPNLKVGFNHGISVFFNQYKVLKQAGIWANFSYNIQEKAITQNNTTDSATGKRTYFPENVNGNRSWNLWTNYNKSNGNKKPNYGIGINGNGSKYINFVDGEKVTTDFWTLRAELNFGIYSEEKYSLNINPNIGYNSSKSSLATNIDNNYLSYGVRAEATYRLPWKMEVASSINADLRQRINAFASNTNLVVWNGGLSKKLLKKDAGKISFTVNDILDDNKGFTRIINSTFVSDDRFQRISRYFLLKFEWSFNKAPGGEQK